MSANATTALDSLIEQLESLYAGREQLFNAFGTETVEGAVATIRSLEDQLLSLYAEGEKVQGTIELDEHFDGEELWTTQDGICDQLFAVSSATADRFKFGFIRMDDEGFVEIYNYWEMELAQLRRSEVMNRNFFKEIAPCTHNRLFYHALRGAVENNDPIDTRLAYTFTYRIKPTPVDIRMVRDPERKKFYMLIKRA